MSFSSPHKRKAGLFNKTHFLFQKASTFHFFLLPLYSKIFMFKRFVNSVSNLGLSFSNSSENKRIRLTNQLTLLSIIITTVFIGLFELLQVNQALIIDCCAVAVYASVLIISRKNYLLARWIFILGLFVHLFILALVYGEASQIHLLFIPVSSVPLVLVDLRKRGQILFFIVLSIVSLCILYQLNFQTASMNQVPPETMIMMRFSFIIAAIVCQGIIIFSIISNFERSERVLGKNNRLLEDQFETMFNNSFDGLFLVDYKERKIIKANLRAVELFEMDRVEDFYTLYGLDLHSKMPAVAELEEMRLSLSEHGFYQGEVLYKTKTGRNFWGALGIRLITINGRVYQSVRVTDISIRKKTEELTRSALREKEILIAEIHHRVKNNLAVISGLIGLQSIYVEDPKAKALFEESRNRIHSMALIHDKLYQHETAAKIDFGAYINSLIEFISKSYNSSRCEVAYEVICPDLFLDIQYAVPCGLILNEIISNSNKHAFGKSEDGMIKIVCTKMGDKFTMMVSDNGVGFDVENYRQQTNSLGLTLIQALTEQLSGNLKTINQNGTTYYLSFEA